MSNGIMNPVQTTTKVKTYLENLIKGLQDKNLNLSQNDIIDVAGHLDQIKKKADKYVSELKKKLPLSESKKSLQGSMYIAVRSESTQRHIEPETFANEVSPRDFYKCVKVSLTDAKKVITEERINEIAIEDEPKVNISFKEL